MRIDNSTDFPRWRNLRESIGGTRTSEDYIEVEAILERLVARQEALQTQITDLLARVAALEGR